LADLLLKAEKLSKIYFIGDQELPALSEVDLGVERGGLVAVMGPSGSGKSTLMNILGCLDAPTSGTYFLEDENISTLRLDQLAHVRNRRIGFVFQSFNLLPRTSALENVSLPLVYGRTSRRERRQRAAQALIAVGLADRMEHQPTQLSNGQQQRVAIARALINEPVLILADEPTGALDTRTGLEIMALFQNLNRQGITIVLVTHDAEIARFARRVIQFRDGRLIGDETSVEPDDAAMLLSRALAQEEAS